ncbi:hypothetical protein ABTK37_20525, partial [Acinetobacter baumannii]
AGHVVIGLSQAPFKDRAELIIRSPLTNTEEVLTMSDAAALDGPSSRPRLDHDASATTAVIFTGLLAVGLAYTAYSLYIDVVAAGV